MTDTDQVRRVIFDQRPTSDYPYPEVVTYQRMDDSLVTTGAVVDIDRHVVVLTNDDESRAATFTFEQPTADRLALDGELNGRKVRMLLERLDTNTFPLVHSGFHGTQE